MNLHFKLNADVDYGLHDQDGGQIFKQCFVTDEGYIRVRIEQNYDALTGKEYDGAEDGVRFDDLGNIDLTNLFSLLNMVVVTDVEQTPPKTGRLTIRKIVAGNPNEADALRLFHFRLNLTGSQINSDTEFPYYFYGEDKAGTIKNGGELWLHHDEAITILGIPAGAAYKVTELTEHGYIVVITDETGNETDGTGTIEANTEDVVEFTNTKTRPNIPTDPDDPDNPNNPDDPDNPDDPNNPDNPNDPDDPWNEPGRLPFPDTGLRRRGVLAFVLCASGLGLAALCVLAFWKRGRRTFPHHKYF